MRNRRPRNFRYRSNNRNFRHRAGDSDKPRMLSGSFTNGMGKNNFKHYQSAEKLLERYKTLAKEALSAGDKILSENYLQHVDHFVRIVSHKNLNQNKNDTQITKETDKNNNNSLSNGEVNQDTPSKSKE